MFSIRHLTVHSSLSNKQLTAVRGHLPKWYLPKNIVLPRLRSNSSPSGAEIAACGDHQWVYL